MRYFTSTVTYGTRRKIGTLAAVAGMGIQKLALDSYAPISCELLEGL